MKYFLLILLFLTGCGSPGFDVGKKVKVKDTTIVGVIADVYPNSCRIRYQNQIGEVKHEECIYSELELVEE